MKKDDPIQIAKYLVATHGLEGAMREIVDGLTNSHQKDDKYSVSIWRDVRAVVRQWQEAEENNKAE